ncbi:MAG: hypothetical protein CMM94_02900 [Rickettsiales bacterium]|nr:hypothetical protein [Rickettsiales bacterium]
MHARPIFFKSVYSEDELDDCFDELMSAAIDEQDKIEIACLIQYFAILKYHEHFHLPVDFIKNRQGEGPDFTICNGSLFGVEMTKATTADYQVWLKKSLNYRPIKSLQDYQEHRPEQRVSDLAMVRVQKKNYKIQNYFYAVPEMEYCDLVLEEDGDCCMHTEVLMDMLQQKIGKLRYQKFRKISMISGSILYYAINTCDAAILPAPVVTAPPLSGGVTHANLSLVR